MRCTSWQADITTASSSLILPDGCQDLILKSTEQNTTCLLSPLFDSAQLTHQKANTTLYGFRFQAGSQINQIDLLRVIEKEIKSAASATLIAKIAEICNDLSQLNHNTETALACLAQEESVAASAKQLGLSVRTLQRVMLKETQRPPSYWLQLARCRKAARQLLVGHDQPIPLAELASDFKFSDQSHMTREFQRWFQHTPKQALSQPDVFEQLAEPAYA